MTFKRMSVYVDDIWEIEETFELTWGKMTVKVTFANVHRLSTGGDTEWTPLNSEFLKKISYYRMY